MKMMKKLQVAVAAASLFAAAGSSMAASISQSGITIAREAISANTAATQTLRAPTVSYSYDNGPTANANSTQDFNVTLQLGGAGDARWGALPAGGVEDLYKTVAAVRRNNGNAVVPVLPFSELANVGAGKAALVLMAADRLNTGGTNRTIRYKFRLVNNTAGGISIGDLQLAFGSTNLGDGTAAPWDTGNAAVTGGNNLPVSADYPVVTNLATAVNALPVTTGTSAGETGNVADGCGEGIRAVTVLARNFIGSGDGVEGESQGANIQSILNGGYIQFQTALAVKVEKFVAVDRNTDPLQGNQQLTTTGAANNTNTMALGTVRFSNNDVDAFDTDLELPYYKFGPNDLDGNANQTNGDVDVSSLRLNLSATNGFAAGTEIGLSRSPSCAPGATVWADATVLTNDGSIVNKNAAATFNVAALDNAFAFGTNGAGAADNSLLDGEDPGAYGAPFTNPNATAQNRIERAFICMQVPGTGLIPQSRYSGSATLFKAHSQGGIGLEQANFSCPAELAGLGGGIKIDVRNYMEFPADAGWRSYVRVINNSETVTADVFAQYIRADGSYGRWVKLADLPPRGARFFSDLEIKAAMAANGTNSAAGGANQDYNTGVAAAYANANARLRISSEAASTLRVQNYIYNEATKQLSEMSGAQGADFVNLEASSRDHIDQDAQTGIKK